MKQSRANEVLIASCPLQFQLTHPTVLNTYSTITGSYSLIVAAGDRFHDGISIEIYRSNIT